MEQKQKVICFANDCNTVVRKYKELVPINEHWYYTIGETTQCNHTVGVILRLKDGVYKDKAYA